MFSSTDMQHNSVKHQSFFYTQLNDQFQIIQFNMSTKLDRYKYCYIALIIQLNINHSFTHCYMIKQFYFKQFNLS